MANVSNTVGLVPGNASGAIGYRRELAGQPRSRVVPLIGASLIGGVAGAILDESLQRIDALKVVLVGLVNLVSGIVFVFAAHVSWAPAGLIAGGSILGGALGSRYGRRLPPVALRAIIVVVGVVAIVHLLA